MYFALRNWKAGIIAAFALSVQFQVGPSNITIKCWGSQSASEQNSDIRYPQPL